MSKASNLPAAQDAANVPAVMGDAQTALALGKELGFAFDAKESVENIPLARIGISRETCMFALPQDDGSREFAKTVTGNVIYVANARAWYPTKYNPGETSRPECYAIGSMIPEGENTQASSCDRCAHRKVNGKLYDEEAGLACNEKKRIMLLREDSYLPYLLDIPALGLKATNLFLTTYAAKKGNPPLPLAILEFSLKERISSTSGQKGTEPMIRVVGVVTEMARAREIKETLDAFGHIAQTATFEEDAPNDRSTQATPTGDDGFPGEPGADEEF